MRILTPELIAHSFGGVTNTLDTEELNFNLGRREGLVINSVTGQMQIQEPTGTYQLAAAHQELDLDPDNIDILGGHPAVATENFIRDSTRIFVQKLSQVLEVAANAGYGDAKTQYLQENWYALPLNERPLTINNMRHNFEVAGGAGSALIVWLTIRYVMVELSDSEIGLTAVLRR